MVFRANQNGGSSGTILLFGGNVGIGNSDPNALLTLKNSATNTRLELDTESAGSSVLSYDRTASAYKILYLRGSDIQLNPNDVNAVIVKVGGNVGIGTSTPSTKLHVAGGDVTITTGTYGLTTNSSILENSSGDSRSVGQFLGNPSVFNQVGAYDSNTVSGSIAGIKFNWYSENWMISATRSGGTPIYGFVISQNYTERLVIGVTGNVGIGTVSPETKLDVRGTIYTYDSEARIKFKSTGGTGREYDFIGGNDGTFYFYDRTAAAYRYVINSSGNFGIGTTSPSYKLDVNGTSAFRSDMYVTNTSTYWYNGTSYFEATNSSNVGILKMTNNSSPISLQPSGGNVGIGTTSPAYLLDVNGTARVTTLIETSALKYKTNIQPLESQLSKILQLQPVTFDWINKPNPKPNIGLIADEVEKIYPEFVSKTENGEIEGIEYSKLTAVLIQSIKELKEIVDKQQEQINRLLNK
jgi:hypothetical protein